MEVWSYKEIKYFISLVSRYPFLFDPKNPLYKDSTREKREAVWQEIAQEMKITSENCKKHWKTMRDGYKRYKRKNNLPIGSEVPKIKRTNWKLYRLLTFLDNVPHESYSSDCINNEPGSSQNPEEKNAEETSDSSLNYKQESDDMSFEDNNQQKNASNNIEQIYVPDLPTADLQMGIEKRPRSRGDVFKNKVKGHTPPLRNISEVIDEEFQSFAKYTEQILKNLPTKLLQVKAKREIFDVLSKYEVLAAETSVSSSQRPSYINNQTTAGHRYPQNTTLMATPSCSKYSSAATSDSDSDDE